MGRRAIALAAVLALGLLAGRLSAAGSPAPSLPADPPGPTSKAAGGVGVGYAHTRAGAVAAATNYQRDLSGAALLGARELRRRIEVVATPDFAPVMIAANAPGARRIAKGQLGIGRRAKIPTAYLGVPVSYRLLYYSPQRAVIRNWGLTIVGNASTVEPSAYFGLSRVELVWSRGDWKIADTRGSYGPTPKLTTPRSGGEGFGVVDVLEEMRPYVVAP